MGGSSFLFTCAAIGIVLSVARNVEQLEGKAAITPVKPSEGITEQLKRRREAPTLKGEEMVPQP
jgi:hypothetical protein